MATKTVLGAISALIIALAVLSIPSPDEIAVDTAKDVVQEIGTQIENPLYQEVNKNLLFGLDLLGIAILVSSLSTILSAIIAVLKSCG